MAASIAVSAWLGITIQGMTVTPVSAANLSISVSGNHLVDANHHPIQLVGVDRAGTENQCLSGNGVFLGPSDDASVAAIAGWAGVNAVRIPLNEDCWLGINGVPSADSGANYQNQIKGFVTLLHQHGLYAIVDLHYAAAGSAQSTSREPMADADHASAFWTSVASTFVSDPAILFDLYSAPNVSWSCWQNGCSVSGYTALGMNQLVSAVRATGAKQPLILSGNGVGNDLSGWLANKPSDPSLVAGLQVFETTSCTSATCWNTTVKPVADSVPVVATEVGTSTCNADLPTALMNWADANDQVSYLGWAWVIWSGSDACRDMITNYSGGATTPFGAAFQTHFASRVSSPTPTPTTSTGSTPTPTPTGSQPHNPTPPAVPTPPAPPSGAPSSGGGSTSGGGGSSSGGTGSGSSGGSGSVPAGGLPALPAPPPPPGGDQNNSSASGSIPAPPPPPPPPPLVGVGALAGANIGSADGNPSNSTSSQTGTAGVRSGGGVGSVAGAVAAGAKAIGLPSAVVGFTILELVGSIGAGLILLLLGAALLVIRRQSGQSVAANGSGPTAAPVPITERRW